MNKGVIKIITGILCVAIVLSGLFTGGVLAADREEKTETTIQKTETSTKKKEEISKDETVYVLSDAEGGVQKIIVSDWIKNALNKDAVKDTSNLSDIQNVKDDKTYVDEGENKVWDAQGNDIYYQGNMEKELPVGLKISYQLDGKPISAEEISGKSGKVRIRFDYQNRQFEKVKINGKKEKIYVPFVVLSGLLLDNEHFRNVEVSNGKLINDGDRTAILGIAFPGLQKDLGIKKEQMELPDYVEITADAEDFTLGMTITVATNELFGQVDTSKMDSIDELKNSLGELTEGMQKLLDGSSSLYEGLGTLLMKAGELSEGIDQISDGAGELKNGISTADAGVAQLSAGASALKEGLNQLNANSGSLNAGARQVFETLLSTAETQIKEGGISIPTLTIENYAEVMNGVIASLDETTVYNQALAQVTAAVEANRSKIVAGVTEAVREQVKDEVKKAVQEQVTEGVTAAVREQVTSKVIFEATGMSKAEYDAAVAKGLISPETQNQISGAIEAQMQTGAVKTLIEKNIAAKMESSEIQETIETNTNAQMQTEAIQKTIADNVELQVKQAISENMASEEVQAKLAAASEGAKAIISAKASLDGYNTFYIGVLTYTNGVTAAAEGASSLETGIAGLKAGTTQLVTGASSLYDGTVQIKNGMPALLDGISKLKDGGMQLNDGLKEFDEKGVQKIEDFMNGNLENFVNRLKATVEVSKKYRNFSGISDEMDGQVKFIYRTEEIH